MRKAALAQLVEHRIRNAGAVGSNPIGGTMLLILHDNVDALT